MFRLTTCYGITLQVDASPDLASMKKNAANERFDNFLLIASMLPPR